MTKLLIDTNVLIDHLRGDPEATVILRDVEAGRVHASVSVITESELLSGRQFTPHHLRQIETLLALFPKVAVTSRVARLAAQFRRHYQIDLPDALIAATATIANATLVTRNLKHFRPVKELRLHTW